MLNKTKIWTATKVQLRRYLARHRQATALRKLAQYCETFLHFYNNYDHNMAENGEVAILDALRGSDPRVLFDVGANQGDWANVGATRFPNATIHCFEIVSDTFSVLERRFADNPRLVLNEFGLSNEPGEVTVQTYDGRSDISTLYSYPEHAERCVTRTGRVIRGDDYIASHQIERIDLLKIDVEGAELRVFHGFERSLSSGLVAMVQFEYGMVNIMAGVFLRDLYQFLSSRGFVVGKIFPTYVDFRPYELADDDFRGPNYLAVRSDRPDLIRRVQVLRQERSD